MRIDSMRRLLKRLFLGLLALMLVLGAYLGWVFGHFALNLQHFPADAAAGYHADFYAYVPPAVARQAGNGEPAFLLAQPNNTGSPTDDVAENLKVACWILYGRRFRAAGLEVVLLVPAFLRPRDDWQVYAHALDRDSVSTGRVAMAPTDLQLIARVDRRRSTLGEQD